MTGNIQIMDKLWDHVLEKMQSQIPNLSFDTWIKPLTMQIEEGNMLVLTAPNEFSKEWINERYKKEINQLVNKLTGNQYIIKVATREEQKVIHNKIKINDFRYF